MHHKRQHTTITIHRKVACIIQRYIEDPRLKNITITAVELSKKLDYANISLTQLNPQYTDQQTLEGCQKAASKIRSYLARELARARTVPKLRFRYDNFLVKSTQLHHMIKQSIDDCPT